MPEARAKRLRATTTLVRINAGASLVVDAPLRLVVRAAAAQGRPVGQRERRVRQGKGSNAAATTTTTTAMTAIAATTTLTSTC
jgi:hypothetical protein